MKIISSCWPELNKERRYNSYIKQAGFFLIGGFQAHTELHKHEQHDIISSVLSNPELINLLFSYSSIIHEEVRVYGLGLGNHYHGGGLDTLQ